MDPQELSDLGCTRGAARLTARLTRIRAYVDMHLSDPALCATGAAQALGMSVRSLHLALASADETFGALVKRRRLAACQCLLRQPGSTRTIAEIAFASGFNSLSSFYRAFRRVYGSRPRPVTPACEAKELRKKGLLF